MILRILIIGVALIGGVLIYAATRPSTFHIQRSQTMRATPDRIFVLINDLHNWSRWQSTDREDSSIKRNFSGSQSGVGAICDWEGRGSSGKGRMAIVQSDSPSKLVVQADWVAPFQARNMNEFILEPNGTSTTVTWSMTGPNLFVMRLMGVFTNMDRMMGKHFEDGLNNLKTIAEQ
jgi:hypothetical protein